MSLKNLLSLKHPFAKMTNYKFEAGSLNMVSSHHLQDDLNNYVLKYQAHIEYFGLNYKEESEKKKSEDVQLPLQSKVSDTDNTYKVLSDDEWKVKVEQLNQTIPEKNKRIRYWIAAGALGIAIILGMTYGAVAGATPTLTTRAILIGGAFSFIGISIALVSYNLFCKFIKYKRGVSNLAKFHIVRIQNALHQELKNLTPDKADPRVKIVIYETICLFSGSVSGPVEDTVLNFNTTVNSLKDRVIDIKKSSFDANTELPNAKHRLENQLGKIKRSCCFW